MDPGKCLLLPPPPLNRFGQNSVCPPKWMLARTPMAAETLDQYNARLQQLSKHCNFHDKDREVKSQIIQRCAMSKVRDKGLSEPTITLQRLLTFGRTLEATLQQSKIMGNCSVSVPTPVHAVSKDGGGGATQLGMWRCRRGTTDGATPHISQFTQKTFPT